MPVLSSLLLTPDEQKFIGSIFSHCLVGTDPLVTSIYQKLQNLNDHQSYPLPDLDLDHSTRGYLYFRAPMVGKVISYNVQKKNEHQVHDEIVKLIKRLGGEVIDG